MQRWACNLQAHQSLRSEHQHRAAAISISQCVQIHNINRIEDNRRLAMPFSCKVAITIGSNS
eukprot:scaffold302192_cov35-Prasinocladus_malaysianus.AAC.1